MDVTCHLPLSEADTGTQLRTAGSAGVPDMASPFGKPALPAAARAGPLELARPYLPVRVGMVRCGARCGTAAPATSGGELDYFRALFGPWFVLSRGLGACSATRAVDCQWPAARDSE